MKLNLGYLSAVIILITVSVHGLFNSLATGFGLTFPYTTFLSNPSDLFADIVKIAASLPGSLPDDLSLRPRWELNYFNDKSYGGVEALKVGNNSHFHPPPLAMLVYLVSRAYLANFSGASLVLITVLLWLLPLLIAPWFLTNDKKKAALVSLSILVAYPVLFAISRGNIIAGFTGVAIVYAILLANEKKHILIFVFLLGIAFNLRPNAVIFILIPFIYFPFKSALKIASGACLAATALFFLGLEISRALYPDYNIRSWLRGVEIYHSLYVIGDAGLAFGSSGFGAVKFVLTVLGFSKLNLKLINYVIAGVALITLLSSIYLFSNKKIDKISMVFIISALYVVSSSVLADYHLIIFIAFILLTMNDLSATARISTYIPLAASILILVPKNLMFIHGYSLQTVLNPLLLILTLCLIFARAHSERLIHNGT
jgi:hypothetical protein